jgi:hypothetical protein
MGYFFRFLTSSTRPVDLSKIYNALSAVNPKYRIRLAEAGPRGSNPEDPSTFKDKSYGLMVFGGQIYGLINLCPKDSENFREDMDDMLGTLKRSSASNKQDIIDYLQNTNMIVCFQIIEKGWDDIDSNQRVINPLFKWLFAEYTGLLHIQNEGYYDKDDKFVLDTSDCEISYIDQALEFGFPYNLKANGLGEYIKKKHPELVTTINKVGNELVMTILYNDIPAAKIEVRSSPLKSIIRWQMPYPTDNHSPKLREFTEVSNELTKDIMKFLK